MRVRPALLALAVVAGCGTAEAAGAEIRVLSNGADLVSGGSALVEISGVGRSFTVDVDGRDVTSAFARRADGRILGLVDGLALGANVLRLRRGGQKRVLIVTNHPVGGPVFSGAQIQPWVCTTERNGLGSAQDAQCNARTAYAYYYRPQGGSGFRPYDVTSPPADVAMTTTDQGRVVPYVVRQETGTQNRGIYRIAVLFDPATEWRPWAPQRGWNRKLHYPFGASCGTLHVQGDAQNVLLDRALSRGFMVATSSLNVLGSNCNATTSAEAVMMLKEHIVETYGEIRYTMAEGGSGGAIGQHMVANNYPGLLQGIQPAAGYEDYESAGIEVADCYLLMSYYDGAAPALWDSEPAKVAVTGHATLGACNAWRPWFAQFFDPQSSCGLDPAGRYHPVDNPRGCRGDVRDFNVATTGRRPPELWDDSPSEETRIAEGIAGGFATLSYDNTGVQYGLQALREGRISAEQFVDLNENIGAFDIDAHRMAGRRRADPGSERLYRTGAINDGAHLDQVAIVDLRPTSNFEIHTDYHSYAMRARLDRSNGHHDNQVIWTHTVPEMAAVADQAFVMLDQWLEAVEADTSGRPLEARIVRNKPAAAIDTCFIDGERQPARDLCEQQYPYYGSPRLVAGMPMTHDILSCQLKPLDPADYSRVQFSDAQWARLEATYPHGVCDYSQPAIGQESSAPWMTYADGFAGRTLEPARPSN